MSLQDERDDDLGFDPEEPGGEAEGDTGREEEQAGEQVEETPAAEPRFPELESEGPPATKPCVFCGSEIAFGATRCAHCAGFLPIAEGTIFKQYFFFLFASLALAIGCLLPWERTTAKFNLTGVDSITGSFLFLFALYGVIVSVWNIYHRKMIVWPVLLASIDGCIFGWTRVVQIAKDVAVPVFPEQANAIFKVKETVLAYATSFGPGLYLVTFFSSIVILSVIVSIFQGAKQDARRKAEEREARATARQSRRSS